MQPQSLYLVVPHLANQHQQPIGLDLQNLAVNIGDLDLHRGSRTDYNNANGYNIGGIKREFGAGVNFGGNTNIIERGAFLGKSIQGNTEELKQGSDRPMHMAGGIAQSGYDAYKQANNFMYDQAYNWLFG